MAAPKIPFLTQAAPIQNVRDYAIGGGTRRLYLTGVWGAATSVDLEIQTLYTSWSRTGTSLTPAAPADVYKPADG